MVCAADGCDPIRDVPRELLDEGQPQLYWGTESPERREKIIGVVAEVDMAAVVVVGAPLAKRKQERVEPMLWMPDIVAGAVGADRVRGKPQYLGLIRSTVTPLDVPLR